MCTAARSVRAHMYASVCTYVRIIASECEGRRGENREDATVPHISSDLMCIAARLVYAHIYLYYAVRKRASVRGEKGSAISVRGRNRAGCQAGTCSIASVLRLC